MRHADLLETAYRAAVADNLIAALPISVLIMLLLLYVRGMVRAYRAAGDDWERMDRDVKMVFLFAVPLFRGGIKLFLLADRLFYKPKIERMGPPAR